MRTTAELPLAGTNKVDRNQLRGKALELWQKSEAQAT